MIDDSRARLKAYIEKKGYSVASLEKAIGAGNGSIGLFLSGKNKGLGNNLEKILIHFDNLSSRWLLTGEGEPEIDYLGSVDPKNEMHIKRPPKGVTQSEEKGGHLRGHLSEDFGNEMHIKNRFGDDVLFFSREQILQMLNESKSGIEKAPNKLLKEIEEVLNEPPRAKYGDLQEAFESTLQQQAMIFKRLLERIDALEGKKKPVTDERPAKLPGGEE